jgi:hypothetical protein
MMFSHLDLLDEDHTPKTVVHSTSREKIDPCIRLARDDDVLPAFRRRRPIELGSSLVLRPIALESRSERTSRTGNRKGKYQAMALGCRWSIMKSSRPATKSCIAGAVVAALASPRVRQRFAEIVQEIPPLEQQTPEALGALQKAEIEKWWPIIKAAGIKPE